ncbi:MAG TPA: hypothetical protein EYP58_05935 [bacterium (Candidatus Stahlbacteria)]|nr:hypothetical protein [Candidatus Stahlbacteria bacterium]
MQILPIILMLADFPIAVASNYQEYPEVSYANDQFNVFWIDYRLFPDLSIYGARVAKDGTVLDPNGKRIYSDSASYSCDVAYDGTNFLVVTRNRC